MIARKEWLEWRRGGIGGSDVAGILGLSPWASAFSVWWSKVRELEDEDSPVQLRGRLLEDAVLQWAKAELGTLVRGVPVVHPELEWARGTPDGWVSEDEGLEAKTVRWFDEEEGWGPDGSAEVPLHYRIQCVWYMAITGATSWRLAAFATIQEDWRIYRLESDPEVADRILEVAGKWWKDHVLAEVPPELDTTSAATAYLRERYGDHSDAILPATAEDLELLEAYEAARLQEKEGKATKDELAVQIKARIADAKGLQGGPGDLRATWSRYDRSSLDVKGLRADHPELGELLDNYTRVRPSGRLTLTRRKAT